MTKKTFQSLVEAVNQGSLYDWLYSHEEELTKEEILHIARELAFASFNPYEDNETVSIYFMKSSLINELADYYSTWGFDDDEEEAE